MYFKNPFPFGEPGFYMFIMETYGFTPLEKSFIDRDPLRGHVKITLIFCPLRTEENLYKSELKY